MDENQAHAILMELLRRPGDPAAVPGIFAQLLDVHRQAFAPARRARRGGGAAAPSEPTHVLDLAHERDVARAEADRLLGLFEGFREDVRQLNTLRLVLVEAVGTTDPEAVATAIEQLKAAAERPPVDPPAPPPDDTVRELPTEQVAPPR